MNLYLGTVSFLGSSVALWIGFFDLLWIGSVQAVESLGLKRALGVVAW